MESNYRKRLIKTVTFLAGVYFFLEFLLPKHVPAISFLGLPGFTFGKFHDAISRGFIVVGTMAIGLGIIDLLMIHGSKIIFRRKQWINSVALLAGLFTMMTVTALDWAGDLKISASVQKVSLVSDYIRRIISDSEKNIQGVPPLLFRNQKLIEAAEPLLDTVPDSAMQAVKNIPAESPENNLAGIQLAELLDSCARSQTYLEEMRKSDLSKPEFAFHRKLAAALAEMSVLQGKILRAARKFSPVSHIWQILFEGLFVSLGSAMFSLLGIYIASAAYRAFRIKSLESSLMMVAAVLVMLGQIPFGLWIYEGMPEIRQWLLECPNSAAFRAIRIGSAVAGLVMALRMWFSLESEYTVEKNQ